MRILICGAGQVGYSIAQQLSREDNQITVVDYNADLIHKINDSLDVRAFVGHASHPSVLQAAGAEDADMLIAVTYSDEVNMVACQIGYSLFNIPTRIARIRHQNYLDVEWAGLYSNEHLALNVIISPEVEVARAITRRLRSPGTLDMIPFADDKVRVIAVRCMEGCPIVNLPISLIRQKAGKLDLNIIGVTRDGKFSVPTPESVLQIGDDVYFITATKDTQRAMTLFGHDEREARRAIILGGGNIGLFLAQELEADPDMDVKLKIIEFNRERAEHIATVLNKATVLNGSALDRDVLMEAGIDYTETVIAVTNDDETNILGALLAKRFGAERTFSLVNNTTYAPLLSDLGIDVTVNPRETTVSRILQHVRKGKITAVHAISDGAAEIIEAIAMATSSLVGKSIAQVNLPKGIIFGAIVRGETVIIPQADTEIVEGDHIIILATAHMVRKVEKIFSVSLEYF